MAKSQTNIEALDDDKVPDKEPRKSSAPRKPARSSSAKAENELRARLTECFDRIAEALDGRGDAELAAIVNEDAEVMAAGLVSMTRPFKVLRMPLLAVVAIVEPMLAFGRIGRVLVMRFADRRAEQQEARAAAMAEAEFAPAQ